MNDISEHLAATITGRRTTKVDKMNGRTIPRSLIDHLLRLADCAPTHGRTEPWRFVVYEGDALQDFCCRHADMYWNHTAPEIRREEKYEKIKQQATHASHLIVTVMKRTADTKIPADEEYAATAAAIQNLLLGAHESGLAAIWSTGGMAHSDAMKQFLKLNVADKVVGFLFLGYSDFKPTPPEKRIPLSDKIVWHDQKLQAGESDSYIN